MSVERSTVRLDIESQSIGDAGFSLVCSSVLFVLRFNHPDWVALQTRQLGLEGTGQVRLRDLVKESLRMRPSRIMG